MEYIGAILGANTLVMGIFIKVALAYMKDQREVWKAISRLNERAARSETKLQDHIRECA